MPPVEKKRIDPWAEVKQLESEEEQLRNKANGVRGADSGVAMERMAVTEIASRSVWLLLARPLSTLANVFGLVYAAAAIILFAQGKFIVTVGKNYEITSDGVILLASWIIVPPFWFAFDYWVLAKTAEARQLVAQSQVLQITVWAATLVVMAFMAKP